MYVGLIATGHTEIVFSNILNPIVLLMQSILSVCFNPVCIPMELFNLRLIQCVPSVVLLVCDDVNPVCTPMCNYMYL